MEIKLQRAKISAIASYFPEKILNNHDLEKMVDTNDQWITERTGIKERHIVGKGEAASDLGAKACQKLLQQTGTKAEDIGLIVCTTVTPDMAFPATACLIQDKIGAVNAGGFDLQAACSGFIFGLSTASKFIETGHCKKVILVSTEVMSSIVDYQDRNTCVLFGDGAAAALIEPVAAGEEELGIIDSNLFIDGKGGEFLYLPGGGSRNPCSPETIEKKMHYVHQEGRQVFKFAVSGIVDVSNKIMKKNNIAVEEVDLLVPHQANIRIIEMVSKRLGIPREKVAVNIEKYGNTTSATIPSCLEDYVNNGTLTKGKIVVLTSFGAGFTWGAVLLRWAY